MPPPALQFESEAECRARATAEMERCYEGYSTDQRTKLVRHGVESVMDSYREAVKAAHVERSHEGADGEQAKWAMRALYVNPSVAAYPTATIAVWNVVRSVELSARHAERRKIAAALRQQMRVHFGQVAADLIEANVIETQDAD